MAVASASLSALDYALMTGRRRCVAGRSSAGMERFEALTLLRYLVICRHESPFTTIQA